MKLAEKLLSIINENLDSKAKGISGYINCRIFVQQMSGVDDIEKLPTVPRAKMQEGDILWWGTPQKKNSSGCGYRHVAVYAGNGDVWQVEEWGASPEKIKLDKVEKYWDKANKIYRPK